MKIAIVHPYPIWRNALGGATRIYRLVRHLAERHEVIVLARASDDEDENRAAIHELAEMGVMQEVFPRVRAGVATKLRWALDGVPYFVHFNRNPALEARLAAIPDLDVAHVELAYLAPLLDGLGDRVVRSLAEQETMSFVLQRLRHVPAWLKTPYQHYIVRELDVTRRFERAALPSFDLVHAITEEEAVWLTEVRGSEVDVLPHVVSVDVFTPPAEEPTAPRAMFIGNYAHRPNHEAAFWFAEQVWPALQREVPGVEFALVGPGLGPRDAQKMERLGIWVPGRVEDLVGQYGRSAVFLNPLRSGAGMRGKVLEAFACGRAVVSTQLGMEGIAAKPDLHFLQADDPASFVQATARLLQEPATRASIGRAGRELVEQTYHTDAVLSRLESEFERAVSERRR